MATTGTYGYAPSAGEVLLNAFSRIGIRGPDLLADHMQTASTEANLLQAQWSNTGPNLWAVDQQSVPLIQGIGTYPVPSNTVMILDAWITTTDYTGSGTDRVIVPVSRTEYASYPNKTQQSPPTCYWFDRLISPTITLWAVPDQTSVYTLNYFRYRQIQDAALGGGAQIEIPYLWLDALAAAMAHRLSRHYAPQLEQLRKADAVEAYQIAATQNTEDVDMYIAPMLAQYSR